MSVRLNLRAQFTNSWHMKGAIYENRQRPFPWSEEEMGETGHSPQDIIKVLKNIHQNSRVFISDWNISGWKHFSVFSHSYIIKIFKKEKSYINLPNLQRETLALFLFPQIFFLSFTVRLKRTNCSQATDGKLYLFHCYQENKTVKNSKNGEPYQKQFLDIPRKDLLYWTRVTYNFLILFVQFLIFLE